MSIEEEEDTSLKDLVTKTLQSNGVLGKIQAQLRASVFLALEEELREKSIPLVSPPTRKLLGTREGAVAASLVQDFLQCLGLDFTLSVFVPESGHPSIWSSPGPDALSSSLGLSSSALKGRSDGEDEKGQKTPLLVELLRERETPPPSAREQNGEASDITSISNHKDITSRREDHQEQKQEGEEDDGSSKQLVDPLSKAPGRNAGGKGGEEGSQVRGGESQLFPSTLPPLNLENGQKKDGNVLGSVNGGTATSADTSAARPQDLPAPTENKTDSDASLNGEDKQYEDDFSSMSEKDGHDDEEEEDEEEEDEEEEEVEEDIEEDLDDISASDLLNSSASGVSDITKDQSLSQASSAPAYEEDL